MVRILNTASLATIASYRPIATMIIMCLDSIVINDLIILISILQWTAYIELLLTMMWSLSYFGIPGNCMGKLVNWFYATTTTVTTTVTALAEYLAIYIATIYIFYLFLIKMIFYVYIYYYNNIIVIRCT